MLNFSLTHFSEQLSLVPRNGYGLIMLCEDFNLNMQDHDNNENSLPMITKPSPITDETATLIDNIFTSHQNRFVSAILFCDISDQPPLIIRKRNMFQRNLQHTL